MLIIDRFAYTNRLTKFNPYLKTMAVVLMIILSVSSSDYRMCLFISLLSALLTLAVAGIPVKPYLKMLSIPLIYMALGIVSIVLSVGFGSPHTGVEFIGVWQTGLGFYAGITRDSLAGGLMVTTRAVGAVSSMYFYILTTPCNQQVGVFKRLRIPALFIEIYVLTYRFIALIFEEAAEIHTAQSIRFGYEGRKNSMHSLAVLIKSLFVRVMTRYVEMEQILEIKHFDGNFYV